jgi:hypothetical protein
VTCTVLQLMGVSETACINVHWAAYRSMCAICCLLVSVYENVTYIVMNNAVHHQASMT